MLPTIGRIVWFFADPAHNPNAAIVTHVWDDRGAVNLCVFNMHGFSEARSAIPFIADPAGNMPPGNYCRWPDRTDQT